MFFNQLSEYFQKIESTSSRNEMTIILAELFGKVSTAEISQVSYLLLGRIGPQFEAVEFGLAEKMMIKIIAAATGHQPEEVRKSVGELGDFGLVTEKIKKAQSAIPSESQKSKIKVSTVVSIFDRLFEVAKTSGTGSQEKKIKLMADLLSEVDAVSAKYLARIPLGIMRLGLADKTIIDALSWMRTGSKKEKEPIEKAYFVVSDIGEIAKLYKENGLAGLKSLKPRMGVPIMPQLCERVPTAAEIIEKMGQVAVQPKYDGTRIQLHASKKKKMSQKDNQLSLDLGLEVAVNQGYIKGFTRNLEEVTYMFPELVNRVWLEVKAEEVILDGEVVGFNPDTGEFLPFQETVQRKRKYNITNVSKEIPVKYFVFDLLYLDGQSMMGLPYSQRREALEKIITNSKREKTFILSPQIETKDPKELSRYFEEEITKGLEGVVIKKTDSAYEAGARGYSWVKFKREEKGELEDTIDCVVLGYNFGTGKRTSFGIGAFLVGVYDEKQDLFKTIAKIGTGLSDEEWRQLRVQSEKSKVQIKPVRVDVAKELTPDVWVEPRIVVIIRADEITRSPIHTAGKSEKESGYALRFPRIMGFRQDKSAEEVTTVEEIKKLYRLQKRVG